MERMYPTGCLTYNDDERPLGSLQEVEERDVWPMMMRCRWALFKRLRRGMSDLWWWEAAGLSSRGWGEGCLTYYDERSLGSLQEVDGLQQVHVPGQHLQQSLFQWLQSSCNLSESSCKLSGAFNFNILKGHCQDFLPTRLPPPNFFSLNKPIWALDWHVKSISNMASNSRIRSHRTTE